jgi:hypothetical protein
LRKVKLKNTEFSNSCMIYFSTLQIFNSAQ